MMSRFMCDAPLCSPILSGHINRFALSGSPMDTYHIFVRAYQSGVTTQVSSCRHLREPEGSRGSHLPTSSTIACAMGRRKLVGDLACSLFRVAKSQPLAKNTLSQFEVKHMRDKFLYIFANLIIIWSYGPI